MSLRREALREWVRNALNGNRTKGTAKMTDGFQPLHIPPADQEALKREEDGVEIGGAGSEAEISQEEQVLRLIQERDEYLDHLRRLQAEFDNYRKRTLRERAELADYILQPFLVQLLAVAENLDRALHPANQTPDVEAYRQGVEMVYQRFMAILNEQGLERMNTVGESFDPNWHEAVAQVETEEVPPGTIVAELAPGYRLKERLLQAAKVQVAARPLPREDETD